MFYDRGYEKSFGIFTRLIFLHFQYNSLVHIALSVSPTLPLFFQFLIEQAEGLIKPLHCLKGRITHGLPNFALGTCAET